MMQELSMSDENLLNVKEDTANIFDNKKQSVYSNTIDL